MEPNPKHKKPRFDTFKTKIARSACKFPLEVVKFECPQLVRQADYKSSSPSKYESAFKHAFVDIWDQLLDLGLVPAVPNTRNFVDLICLHFPEAKVLAVAEKHGFEHVAR